VTPQGGPLSPSPLTGFVAGALPAYLSNGVIGLRVGQLPLRSSVAIISGFAGVDPPTGVESFAPGPYPVAGDVVVDGVSMRETQSAVRLVEQRYDFSCGELVTRLRFEPGRAVVDVEVVTFCSRSHPHVVLQQVSATPDKPCDLSLRAIVDPGGAPGSAVERRSPSGRERIDSADGTLLWEATGALSRCAVAYLTEINSSSATAAFDPITDQALTTSYDVRARGSRKVVLRQIAALVPDAGHLQPDLQAVRLATAAREFGFDGLRDANRELWAELWRGRPILHGAGSQWQRLSDAAHFYLHTSSHHASPASTSMFGLAFWPDYHYYRGHVMWDIEAFAVPPLILTNPSAARGLLCYRSHRIQAATRNAAMAGYRGVQFPWESSPRLGEESAPGAGEGAAHEHHVNQDVALAFARFVDITGDREFERQNAWPVLSGVATWLESRVFWRGSRAEIRRTNGVAELEGRLVDNNAFVNGSAVVTLQRAAALADRLADDRARRWRKLADAIVIPTAADGGIKNHDRHRRDEPKGATPEAAAALWPVGLETDPECAQATYKRAVDDAERYLGAPMLSAMLGVYAARLGDRARARDLFQLGYADFVVEPFTVTLEYEPTRFPEMPQAGPFTANMGGFLMALLYGLPGLEPNADDPGRWPQRAVVLPDGWDAIEVERVCVRGRPMALEAEHGASAGRLRALDS
jgi:trehalose/maltose hydrolase-like predicted phosphorylase